MVLRTGLRLRRSFPAGMISQTIKSQSFPLTYLLQHLFDRSLEGRHDVQFI